MEGMLIGEDTLRVYSEDKSSFVDYKIVHPDLQVKIVDTDFTIRGNMIDVSNKTLGIK